MKNNNFYFKSSNLKLGDPATKSGEYAYDQLKRKDITPNEAIVESILATFMKDGKVHVTTEAEKGMILWKAA